MAKMRDILTKKDRNRWKMFHIREKGNTGETFGTISLVAQGYGAFKKHKTGCDVSARKLDVFGRPTGLRVRFEFKHGRYARMSKAQKKMHKELGSRRHKVLRVGWE